MFKLLTPINYVDAPEPEILPESEILINFDNVTTIAPNPKGEGTFITTTDGQNIHVLETLYEILNREETITNRRR
jgi:hypothetical protein